MLITLCLLNFNLYDVFLLIAAPFEPKVILPWQYIPSLKLIFNLNSANVNLNVTVLYHGSQQYSYIE